MRLVGRISDWNEAKGYGFVTSQADGVRTFVHIKAFQIRSRRPVNGELISYSVVTDSRGRANATEVRFPGQVVEKRTPHKPMPRLAIGVSVLLASTAGSLFGMVPAVITLAYQILSTLSYLMYTLDKTAAGKGWQRTPEITLHTLDLLGGWPGALIAQQQARHKTVKTSFQVIFWMTVLFNIAAVVWLLHSGIAGALTSLLLDAWRASL